MRLLCPPPDGRLGRNAPVLVPSHAPGRRENHLREKSRFASAFKAGLVVQIATKKYFSFVITEIDGIMSSSRLRDGAYRDRHGTRGGDAMDAAAR
jgi:hypothetical protein